MSEDKNQSLPRGLIGRKGGPTGKAARLPSLRGPRDLTLGGVPKKVFTPNIPSRRDKTKDEEQYFSQCKRHINRNGQERMDSKKVKGSLIEPSSGPSKPKSSKESNRGKGRRGEGGRGRGRGQDNVIQSTSIFEQGPADRMMPKLGGSAWDGRDSVSTSKVSVKREKTDKESTKRVLDSILRDDFVDDGHGETDPNLIPVVLPFSAGASVAGVKKEEVKDEKKLIADKIKVEPGTEMEVDSEQVKEKTPDVTVLKTEAPVFTCKDLLSKCSSDDGNRLVFLQLPDVLPGLPPSRDEPVKPKVKTEPGTEGSKDQGTNKSSEDKLAAQMSTCSLTDFSEGFIGKLQIRKSGKAELVLGNVTLDVSVGTPCGFLQDLVSVKVEDGTGHITSLGHVRDRLICTPDFDSLLQES